MADLLNDIENRLLGLEMVGKKDVRVRTVIDMEPALVHRMYQVPPPGQREMYVNMFDREVDLRPRVEVRGYVAKSLWDELP